MRDRQVLIVVEQIQRREHGHDVAIMHEAKEHIPHVRSSIHQIRRGVKPKPSHERAVRIPGPGAIVVDDISSVFEIDPVLVCEDVAPRTTATDERFEAAHFLHAIDLCVREDELGILVGEARTDRREIGGAEFEEHGDAVVMAVDEVVEVAEAGVAWC